MTPARRNGLAFMDKYYPEGDKASSFTVYGYTVAQTLVEVLKKCGDDLTRANVMKQAASLKSLIAPDAAARHHHQHQRRRTSRRSSRCRCRSSTASAGSCSARS